MASMELNLHELNNAGIVELKHGAIVSNADYERLFMTFHVWIRKSEQRRKSLTERATAEFQKTKGNSPVAGGLFVASIYNEKGAVNQDLNGIFSKLEWWDLKRCEKEPLPCYPRSDKYHDSDLRRRLNSQRFDSNQLVVCLTWTKHGNWGNMANTIGHWNGAGNYRIMHDLGIDTYKVDANDMIVLKTATVRASKSSKACEYQECDTVKLKLDYKGERVTFDNTSSDRELSRCSRCVKVWYCSRECQKSDWKRHKPECKR